MTEANKADNMNMTI